jgi:Phage-related protein
MVRRMTETQHSATNAEAVAQASAAIGARHSRILFTSGENLIPLETYRGAFERSLERALANTPDLADEVLARAFAASVTANACTEYRATTTAGIPLKVVDPAGNDLKDTPLAHFLATSANLLGDITRSALTYGRFYVRKVQNAAGYPTGLKYLNPLLIEERDDGRGRLDHYQLRREDGSLERLSPNEVIYQQVFDPRPFGNGLSKFEAAWLALNIEQSVSTYAAAFFVNGAQPDGFLSYEDDLTPDEYEEAKEEWRKNHKGVRNGHKTAVMPGKWTWTPTTTAPKDLAMVELKDAEREDICAVFEVDPILVGLKGAADPLSANSTYSVAEVAHLRRVTLPFLRTFVLNALNTQWALTDFDPRDIYTLAIDESAIAALAEAQFAKASVAQNLATSGIFDYAEARDLLGYGERDKGYLLRPASEPLAMWQAGTLSLNALHTLVFGEQYLGTNGDVVLIGGQLYPVERLAELADANVARMLTPTVPDTALDSTDTPETLAQPDATPVLPNGGKSLCVALRFGAHPDLVALQQRLHGVVGDAEWNDPQDFHTTLFYAPSVGDAEARALCRMLEDFDMPDLSLRVGGFHAFDDLGRYALHFRIRRNTDLLDAQEGIYELALGMNVQPSAYSDPEAYIPHVTMGYSSQRPRAVGFNSRVTLKPMALVVWHGDGVVAYERVLEAPAQAVVVEPSTRASFPLEVAVSFAGNQFVRYARRMLSDALTAQGLNAQWEAEDAWRLTLAKTEQWTPSALASLMRSTDYDDTRKVDARMTGYEQRGDALYARVEGSVDALQKAVGLDLRGAGIMAREPEVRTAVDGILLGTVDGKATALPALDFPLVLNNVRLYVGGEPYHEWALRAASALETKELTNYLNVVRRKGREHTFTFEYLPQLIADYLQVAVADGDEFDDISTTASAILSDVRAYEDTRAAFVKDMLRIIGAAQADESSRAKFAGSMRAAVRQHGLAAFRDGMQSEGYDPESLGKKELAAFRAWQNETSGYITAFGDELFKQGGITEAEVAARADAWANKSLRDVYYRGAALAAADKPKRWKRDPRKDSCSDCVERDGQVKTYAEWEKVGLPGDTRLACHGDHCGCELVDAV